MTCAGTMRRLSAGTDFLHANEAGGTDPSRVHVTQAQVYLRIFDLQHHRRGARGYLLPAACGYATGLLLTYAALYFSLFGDQARPAPAPALQVQRAACLGAASALSFSALVSACVISAPEVDALPSRVRYKQIPLVVGSSTAPHCLQQLLEAMLRAGPAGAPVLGAVHAWPDIDTRKSTRRPARNVVSRAVVHKAVRGACWGSQCC